MALCSPPPRAHPKLQPAGRCDGEGGAEQKLKSQAFSGFWCPVDGSSAFDGDLGGFILILMSTPVKLCCHFTLFTAFIIFLMARCSSHQGIKCISAPLSCVGIETTAHFVVRGCDLRLGHHYLRSGCVPSILLTLFILRLYNEHPYSYAWLCLFRWVDGCRELPLLFHPPVRAHLPATSFLLSQSNCVAWSLSGSEQTTGLQKQSSSGWRCSDVQQCPISSMQAWGTGERRRAVI